MQRLSIIIPFLNEEDSIPHLYERLCTVAGQLDGLEVEIVLVDDGSTDGSITVVRNLPPRGVIVQLVSLSRNFGSHAALAAGVSNASGDAMTFLSADLQSPPEILLNMVPRWREGYEVVWATRDSRRDPVSTRFLANLYYSLLRKLALPQMPPAGVDLCLVESRVIRSLGNLQEKNSNVFNLLLWAGFRQTFIPYNREERVAGSSRWTFAKRIKLFIDSFVAFSFFPIRLISAMGAAVSFFGLLYAVLIMVRALAFGSPVQGWASLMVAVLLCSGLQLLMLGVVSEYLWRVLDAARDRPLYIVRGVETVVIANGPGCPDPHVAKERSAI